MDSGTTSVHAKLKPRPRQTPVSMAGTQYHQWQGCGMCPVTGNGPWAQWEPRCICAGAMGKGLELPGDAFQWERTSNPVTESPSH